MLILFKQSIIIFFPDIRESCNKQMQYTDYCLLFNKTCFPDFMFQSFTLLHQVYSVFIQINGLGKYIGVP